MAVAAPSDPVSSQHAGQADVAGTSQFSDFGGGLVILSDPDCIESEGIRGMRTRIMAQHVREGRRALAICSPTEDTGCSFVAANLAASLAQIGVKTVVVDADLRTPGLTGFFGDGGGPVGLGDYLADADVSIDQIVRNTSLPDLSIITAGTLHSNPQELLSSARFKSLVDLLLREFDFTIFDTTPTNSCTDAQRVGTVAGYCMVVARKHRTHVKDVSTLVSLLRADRATVIGTVLNNF